MLVLVNDNKLVCIHYVSVLSLSHALDLVAANKIKHNNIAYSSFKLNSTDVIILAYELLFVYISPDLLQLLWLCFSVVQELRSALGKMESRVSTLEKRTTAPAVNGTGPAAPQKAPVKQEEEDEDDIDLFGSDEEVDEEAERLKEQRLQEYAAKKAKKPALIAKSSILLDVKPVRIHS